MGNLQVQQMSMHVLPTTPSGAHLHPLHGSGGGHGVEHPWLADRGHGALRGDPILGEHADVDVHGVAARVKSGT